MKNFDLKTYDVHEMNPSEMKKTDGGFFWILGLAVSYIIVEACCNPQAHINAFNQGWAIAAAE